MKRRIEIYTLVLVVLVAAGISLGFQEMQSDASMANHFGVSVLHQTGSH